MWPSQSRSKIKVFKIARTRAEGREFQLLKHGKVKSNPQKAWLTANIYHSGRWEMQPGQPSEVPSKRRTRYSRDKSGECPPSQRVAYGQFHQQKTSETDSYNKKCGCLQNSTIPADPACNHKNYAMQRESEIQLSFLQRSCLCPHHRKEQHAAGH